MIKNILEKHNVYSTQLEIELLRHFDKLRLETPNREKDLMAFLWKIYTFSDPSRTVDFKNILLDIRNESEDMLAKQRSNIK